ncbi:MAG: bifunctional (p)ppGpp synthetase/guanosine-3',5'-bis(diphosphate) 3'-pyrophosphohydrolase [Candidatus Binatia bacterium]
MNVQDLIARIKEYDPGADTDLVGEAYRFSANMHEGQRRASGEAYVTHPLAVAGIIVEMRLDVPTVVTGLLHDAVEDTHATLDDIRDHFGIEVAALVDGVTKITRLESAPYETTQAENLRKMLVASAKDVRVLLVKLADRTHNIRTLQHLAEAKRARIAAETLDLYAPLANRLGINWIKQELEDQSFRILHPAEYEDIRERLSLQKLEREGYVKEITGLVSKRLEGGGIEAEVSGRTKGTYSIWKKMSEQGLRVDDIYDVVGFRALVASDRECYDALGVMHMYWSPVPGRFRDYVALPKANGYQSLHTTLIGVYGERLEMQVRTHEMHRVAEYGVAAHWRYKDINDTEQTESERYAWLKQILEWQQHFDDPREFLSSIKDDLFGEDVFVFTPKGEGLTFRKGDTALDFAYRIHSEVGNHAAGARVNGRVVPLRYVMQQGDTVEVVTTENGAPTRDWLKFVRSPRARERIVSHIRAEERRKAVALGRELLERDLERYNLDLATLQADDRFERLLTQFARKDEESLLEAIGYGRITGKQVLTFLLPDETIDLARPRRSLRTLFGLFDRRAPKPLVMAENLDEAMVRFAKCCEPLPGEEIVGFLTRGRGVTVHSKLCPRLSEAEKERLVPVNWQKGASAQRPVRLEVVSRDRPRLLADMTQAIAAASVNIERASVRTIGTKAMNTFEVTLSSVEDLDRVMRNLRRLAGVKEVRRVIG